jgi:surfactin family lipopeptide synthetase A/fengycin family lipopeptide synthetase D/gramicidin S synthase 2
MAGFLEHASIGMDGGKYLPLQAVEQKEFYPLASVQQRMYALRQLDPDSTAYNVSSAMMVEGGLDRGRLEGVFKALIRGHESFRTSFQIVDGEPVQKIHENVEFSVQYKDNISVCDELTITDNIEDFVRPFDLSRAPLLRVGLVKTGEATHLLLLDMHHIITDGLSMDLFIKEFMALYKGEGETLPRLTHRYKDFAQWQTDRLKSGELKALEDYWLSELSGELPVLDLQTDFPRPAIRSFAGHRLSFCLEDRLTRGIKKLAEETGTTFFIVLLAALNVLLARYTGQEDIIVGTTVAGRGHADLRRIVGLFIETLALRNYPGGSRIFKDFLKEVGDNTLNAFENEAYPFRELMKQVGDPNEVSRNPLFSVMLIVQNIDMAPLEIEQLTFTPVAYHSRDFKVDLTVEVFETETPVRVDLEYCTALFREDTVSRLAGHFVNILKDVIDGPEIPLSEIAMLSDSEVRRLLEDYAGEGGQIPGTDAVRVHQLFENQARQSPADIAVVYKETQFTYEELNERAAALSDIIKEL